MDWRSAMGCNPTADRLDGPQRKLQAETRMISLEGGPNIRGGAQGASALPVGRRLGQLLREPCRELVTMK